MRSLPRRWIVAIAPLCFAGTGALAAASAAVPTAPQQIGSWVLDCSGHATEGGCTLRDRTWLLPPGPGRPAAALEVQQLGDKLVPVVTLRGLSTQAAVGGLLALQPHATLSLEPGPSVALACQLDAGAIVCAPQGDDVAATAEALPNAATVTLRMQLSVPGGMALPAEGGSLPLHGTREALVQLRAVGATGQALPAIPGLDWVGFLDRVMRAAGFENGAAGLVARLAGR